MGVASKTPMTPMPALLTRTSIGPDVSIGRAFAKLRQETPGKYESYADMGPGGIGLWVDLGTEGYFADVKVTPR
jgi:hypothetical protein